MLWVVESLSNGSQNISKEEGTLPSPLFPKVLLVPHGHHSTSFPISKTGSWWSAEEEACPQNLLIPTHLQSRLSHTLIFYREREKHQVLKKGSNRVAFSERESPCVDPLVSSLLHPQLHHYPTRACKNMKRAICLGLRLSHRILKNDNQIPMHTRLYSIQKLGHRLSNSTR